MSWKHSKLVPLIVDVSSSGSVNVIVQILVAPFISVTITLYVPAASPLRSSVVYGPPGPDQA